MLALAQVQSLGGYIFLGIEHKNLPLDYESSEPAINQSRLQYLYCANTISPETTPSQG